MRSPVALPVTEGNEEVLLHVRRDVLLADASDELDRRSHLVEERPARWADRDVVLEAATLGGCEPSFDVVGDELDDVGALHVVPSSRYRSMADRAAALARWRRV